MFSDEVAVPLNIHGRVASHLVQKASLVCMPSVYIEKDDRRISIHSLLGVLSLNIKEGEKVTLYSNSKENLEQIKQIIENIEY